jgi:hypothetical protein
VLSPESTAALNSQSYSKPVLAVVDTVIIGMGGCECLFSSMNDIFTPTKNLSLL